MMFIVVYEYFLTPLIFPPCRNIFCGSNKY